MAAPTLSILVPTHNRADVIARVWPTWLEQEGLAGIVIVNDGSTQDYRPFYETLGQACGARGIQLKTIDLPMRKGAPAARNIGIYECHGDEILTTDDDIQLAPDLVKMCRLHRPAGGRVVCGPRIIYLRDDESHDAGLARVEGTTDPYIDLDRLVLTPWAGSGPAFQVPFLTAVALWPRVLFEEGLRYFEGYGGNGFREETDPQLEAQRSYGATAFLIPGASCFHLPLSLAYAESSGQRRHGPLWYEYWVLRNNALFWARHHALIERKWGTRSFRSQCLFALSRFHPRRLFKWISRFG